MRGLSSEFRRRLLRFSSDGQGKFPVGGSGAAQAQIDLIEGAGRTLTSDEKAALNTFMAADTAKHINSLHWLGSGATTVNDVGPIDLIQAETRGRGGHFSTGAADGYMIPSGDSLGSAYLGTEARIEPDNFANSNASPDNIFMFAVTKGTIPASGDNIIGHWDMQILSFGTFLQFRSAATSLAGNISWTSDRMCFIAACTNLPSLTKWDLYRNGNPWGGGSNSGLSPDTSQNWAIMARGGNGDPSGVGGQMTNSEISIAGFGSIAADSIPANDTEKDALFESISDQIEALATGLGHLA